jgi:hypothetical protein
VCSLRAMPVRTTTPVKLATSSPGATPTEDRPVS